MGVIQEVVLFISEASKACTPCINLIREYDLPVKIVRLDTAEARKNAKYNKKISIKNVPTLLTIFDDDDINIYIGNEKICKWMRLFKTQIDNNKTQHIEENNDTESSNEDEDENITIINNDDPEETVKPYVSSIQPPQKPSAMKSTLEKAKEMEGQMKKQLGGNAFENKSIY